jgi:hypothetical protein
MKPLADLQIPLIADTSVLPPALEAAGMVH